MIILLRSMYKRNEYSTMLQKERNELMHTGNKENNQYVYVPSCIAKLVFPWFYTGFDLHSNITKGVVFLW